MDAESMAVLEYSIHRHASMPVQIEWMKITNDETSFWHGWDTTRWATPFSGFRWGIPARCGFHGRAIYMDSDVIVMDDLAKLWNQPFLPGKCVLGKGGGSWRLCVSLWDCAAAKHVMLPIERLRQDPEAHRKMGRLIQPYIGQFRGHWNVLDGQGFNDLWDPAIGAIHYTDMSCQPHLRHALPRLAAEGRKHWFDGTVRPHPRPDLELLFDELLVEAISEGYSPENYVPNDFVGDFRKASLVGYRGRSSHVD
jgi:hypothetical protein